MRDNKGRFGKGNQAARKSEAEKRKTALSRAERTKKRKEQIAKTREGIQQLTEAVLLKLTEKLENGELTASDLAQLYPKLLVYLVPKLKQEELLEIDGTESKKFTIAIVRNEEDVQKVKELNE